MKILIIIFLFVTPPSKKDILIKDGIFVEKHGDFFPTEKYYILKKTGKLKQYGL